MSVILCAQGSLAEGFFAAYVPSSTEVEMSEVPGAAGGDGGAVYDSSEEMAE